MIKDMLNNVLICFFFFFYNLSKVAHRIRPLEPYLSRRYKRMSALAGLFQSHMNLPDRFKEEMAIAEIKNEWIQYWMEVLNQNTRSITMNRINRHLKGSILLIFFSLVVLID